MGKQYTPANERLTLGELRDFLARQTNLPDSTPVVMFLDRDDNKCCQVYAVRAWTGNKANITLLPGHDIEV